MRKISGIKYLAMVVLAASVTSCLDDDNVVSTVERPIISVDQTEFSVTEGETVTVNLTMDRALNASSGLVLQLADGSEMTFREFETSGSETGIDDGQGMIGHRFDFPAYTTTMSIDITPLIDLDVEGSEVLRLRLTGGFNGNSLVGDDSQIITINVADYVSNDVGARLVWDQTTADDFGTLHEGTYSTAAGGTAHFYDYDFDIYVIDASSFDEVTGYAGATAASPESVVISEDLPDGEYWIIADLYAAGPAPAAVFSHDMHMQISKFGTWSVTIPVEYASNHPTSQAGGGLAGGETIVAVLQKTGSTYTLENEAGDVLAQGRMSSLAGKFKNNIRK